MRPANERRRNIVTSSLIGWVHTLGLHIVTRSDPVSILPDTDPGYRNDTLKTIL